ncbi:MAG TPA: response regulator [Aliiroseovarius sp.]|nr:response regulator [Aliiroseovarius sp.]
MPNELEHFGLVGRPTPERPLQGMTVLVVEDSRFASEAIRLLCLRSGARIRRADTLAAAHRHLAVYRPSAVIVDLGLPDGDGLDLIAELHQARPRVDVILAMSGDDAGLERAEAAGADGVLAKPIESLKAFQSAILRCFPQAQVSTGPQLAEADRITPDPLSLRDDLTHMVEVIRARPHGEKLGYVAQFLSGVAKTAHDTDLADAARDLARACVQERGRARNLDRLAGMIEARLAQGTVI